MTTGTTTEHAATDPEDPAGAAPEGGGMKWSGGAWVARGSR